MNFNIIFEYIYIYFSKCTMSCIFHEIGFFVNGRPNLINIKSFIDEKLQAAADKEIFNATVSECVPQCKTWLLSKF